MGHNPPTHQVWVRMMGLPLQAWTAPEVARVLQRFGHPLQILPFGREAGHFRDITALVETGDPTLIPLAYVYREGDYSTQIDIVILSWRMWEDSYFPPPGNPPFQDGSPSQPRHHDGQITPRRSSSSSSSSTNGAPTEPTVDYSAWSPRSHANQLPLQTAKDHGIAFLSLLQSMVSDHHRAPPLQASPNPNHELATKNQLTIPDINQITIPNIEAILPLQTLSLTYISCPITINPTLFLTSYPADSYIEGETQHAAPDTVVLSAPLLSRPRRQAINAAFIPAVTDTQLAQATFEFQTLSTHDQGPVQPKKRRADTNPHMQAHSHPRLSPYPPSPTQTHPDDLDVGLADEPTGFHPILDHTLARDQNPMLDRSSQPGSESQVIPDPNHMSDISNSSSNPIVMDPESTAKKGNTSSSAALKRSIRENKIPIRRSQRLRAKLTPQRLSPRHSDRIGAQTTKILFDLDLSDKPLDTAQTMHLLQASGLNITDAIKEMIEEAVNQDKADIEAMQAPTTPLHDLIPPFQVPGDNMIL